MYVHTILKNFQFNYLWVYTNQSIGIHVWGDLTTKNIFMWIVSAILTKIKIMKWLIYL